MTIRLLQFILGFKERSPYRRAYSGSNRNVLMEGLVSENEGNRRVHAAEFIDRQQSWVLFISLDDRSMGPTGSQESANTKGFS